MHTFHRRKMLSLSAAALATATLQTAARADDPEATIEALRRELDAKDATIAALSTEVASLKPQPTPTSTPSPSKGTAAESFKYEAGPFAVGQLVDVLVPINFVVTGQDVAKELYGETARGEFLIVYVDITYKIESNKNYPPSFFQATDGQGKFYSEVELPGDVRSALVEITNANNGTPFLPGQVVQEMLVFDVPSAGPICYLTNKEVKPETMRKYAVDLGCIVAS